jgi:hypothetical protein
MDNLLTGSNPYSVDEAVADPVMFFGHSEVFDWIGRILEKELPDEPLILFGRPGVGKSSILKQLELGRLGEGTAVIQPEIKKLPRENLTGFVWALA